MGAGHPCSPALIVRNSEVDRIARCYLFLNHVLYAIVLLVCFIYQPGIFVLAWKCGHPYPRSLFANQRMETSAGLLSGKYAKTGTKAHTKTYIHRPQEMWSYQEFHHPVLRLNGFDPFHRGASTDLCSILRCQMHLNLTICNLSHFKNGDLCRGTDSALQGMA